MDGKVYTEKVKNPRAGANIFSILTFSWVLRIFWVGYRRDLEVTDLYTPLKEHTSGILGIKLSKAWDKECEAYQRRLEESTKSGSQKKVKEPSLMNVLIKCFGLKTLLYGIFMAVMEILLRVLQPLLLGQLLRFFNDENMDKGYAYGCAAGVILCSALNVFVVHPYMMGILHMGMKIRVACCSLIYRKTLKMTRTALGETTIGQAVNLLSNDVNRFDVSIVFLHYLWLGPLETIIITYVMYHLIEVGVSSIIGVASLLMFIPLQAWLGKKSSELRLRTAIRTDERVRLTNEIISGIQAIKMYTWENPFSALIEKARKKEINVIRWASYIRGITMSFIIFSTRMSLFITVLAYVLFGYKITAEKVFMITAYYNSLRTTMTVFFPQVLFCSVKHILNTILILIIYLLYLYGNPGITQVAEAMVSIKRLQKFLMYDELSPAEIEEKNNKENVKENNKENITKNNKEIAKEKNKDDVMENNKENVKEDLIEQKTNDYPTVNQSNDSEYSICIENGTTKWLDYEREDTLQNINIKVRPGELIAIVGQVGSGKTSLLNVILRELRLQEGSIKVAEMRTVGTISGQVYSNYFRAGGNWCIIFMVSMLCILTQLAASGGDFFIARWVDLEENYMNETDDGVIENSNSPISRMECIYIYSGVTVLTIGVTLIRSWAFFCTCMRASMRLHDRMFRSISRATMRFFNTNTSGRVLNRFSKDMGAVDEMLPTALIDCIQIGLSLLGIIVVVAIANVWLLIPTVLVGIVFYYLRIFYLATSRSVKRLEGITRSPVFAHLSATLQGLPTIRAFGAEAILTKEFDNHQDLHSSAWYIFIASSRAFGFWLDVFCVVYIMLVTLSFLVLDNFTRGSIDSGYVGLAITQSIGLTGMFQWGMRQSAELENQMTSVERILEYSKVDSEPPLESTPDKKPKSEWPENGKIEFKNVFLRYAPLEPPVLKNLNFVIFPREKVGIVGRTGAGKSSLIQALFRLADVDGLIEIDGIDSGQIGLHDLRSKISIIPQEPFLFSGSLRRNLDPFDSYTDDPLWRALEEVELKEIGLEAHINEGGSNLSVGQRQLVCLARAIVRNNPILVLDEATANVDPRTDELIQTTIRKKFERCTVLTIAHRLNTVMDSDRILVMDAGNAVEFDHPHVLLQKETGYLKSMVQETGQAMAEALAGVARNCYQNRAFTAL
ncbi:hypothetical protein PUN28_016527 [Cardiocondyla obscurior]|uniref:Multidrug resistance-associated protein lethal(2)03659 n=1 Tax=Cardiocondyla obscurior TaxID=286306 RepID=A0AAW2EMF4_9HYME